MLYKKALAIAFLVTIMTACQNAPNKSSNDGTVYQSTDEQNITVSQSKNIYHEEKMASEGYFIPCTNGSYLIIIDDYGPAEVHPENGDDSLFSELSAGDRVVASHGYFLETYPARTELYTIEKLSDGDISDIPEGTLEKLEQMGWIPVGD
ncbi:MAG: hypothetical protein ACI4Q6_00295 [Huintestinicola sp.]